MPALSFQELLGVFRELDVPVPSTLEQFRELTSAWSGGKGASLRKQRGEQHARYMTLCKQFRSIEDDFLAQLDCLYREFRELCQRLLGPSKLQPLAARDRVRVAASKELRLSDELLELFLGCLMREQAIEFRDVEQAEPPPTPQPLRTPPPPPQPLRTPPPPPPEPPRTPPPPPPEPPRTPVPPRVTARSEPPRHSPPRPRVTFPPPVRRARTPPLRRSASSQIKSFLSLGVVVLGAWLFVKYGQTDEAPPSLPTTAAPPIATPLAPPPAPPVCACDYPGASCQGGYCRLDAGMQWALTPFAMVRVGTRDDAISGRDFAICVSASATAPESCSDPTRQGVTRDASHLNYYFAAIGSVVVTTAQLEGAGIDVAVKEGGRRIAGASGFAYREENGNRLVAGKLLFTGGLAVPVEHPYIEKVVLRFVPVIAPEPGRDSAAPPRIGVGLLDLSAAQRRDLGIDFRAGVLIQSVLADSPARRAGLAAQDVLLAVGGRIVARPEDVQQEVRVSQAGAPLSLQILSRGRRTTLDVVPAAQKESPKSGDLQR